ncbi:MAG: type II secretion system F family protein [bacterium]|nr:type II secretion system F family protein [bacterium]
MSGLTYLYRASRRDAPRTIVKGRLEAADPAQARELLRDGGLLPLSVRRLQTAQLAASLPKPIERWWNRRQRARNAAARADLLDALATMLQTGLPLTEALRSLENGDDQSRPSKQDRALIGIRAGVTSGKPLSECLDALPDWFTKSEVARVRAAEQRGELAKTLASLAESSQRSVELGRRLLGALTYPLIVAAVGLGVVVFLSVRTLPELLGVLSGAGVELPGLSVAVMRFGQTLVAALPWLPFVAIGLIIAATLVGSSAGATAKLRSLLDRWCTPRFIRRMRLASVCEELASMLESGIQIVEGLRLIAASHTGLGGASLRGYLDRVTASVADGEDLDRALPDPRWADTEFVRLIAAGQASGDLPRVLRRIAGRYERDATRRIDRLSSLLEPAVILTLAVLVGTVVMAAVLPLIRLQEVV